MVIIQGLIKHKGEMIKTQDKRDREKVDHLTSNQVAVKVVGPTEPFHIIERKVVYP